MIPRFFLALLLASCAGQPSRSNGPLAVAPAEIAPNADSATVNGLTVLRPENWKFHAADEAMGENAELLLIGPATNAPVRPSISFFRKSYEYRTRRPPAEQLLTTFMVAKRQELAGLQLLAEPSRREIAGHEGASLSARVTEQTLSGETVEQLAHVYAVLDGDHYWAIYALVPDGSDAHNTVLEVIDSLTL